MSEGPPKLSESCFKKRTKVVCTINDGVELVISALTQPSIEKLLLSGINLLRIHMVYDDPKFLEKLHDMRTTLEGKYGVRIPLMVQLKGSTVRLGKFENNIAHLKKGDLFRFFQHKKIVGNNRGCFCDMGDWFRKLKPGDLISVNYGRFYMRVVKKEKLEKGIKLFQENAVSTDASKSEFHVDLTKMKPKKERRLSEHEDFEESKAITKQIEKSHIPELLESQGSHQILTSPPKPDNLSFNLGESEVAREVHESHHRYLNTDSYRKYSENMADSVTSECSGSVSSNSKKLQFRFKFDNAADEELKNRTVLVCEVLEDCYVKSFSTILISAEENQNHKVIPVSTSPIPGSPTSILTKQDINIIDRSLDIVVQK